MGERDRPSVWLRAPLAALIVAGCAHAPQPPAQPTGPVPAAPPQTVTPAAPEPPPGTSALVPARLRDNKPIVIDEGGTTGAAATQTGLGAVAAAERERRQLAGAPTVVIDDKSLKQHATGKLSFTQTPVGGKASKGDGPASPTGPAKDEQYWRDRVHSIRQEWALAVDAITELESRTAGLRTRFYAESDPYVRDGQIKPQWDKALEDLESSRLRARSLEEQLAQALEEGRQAGALPGWLRDGTELEPKTRPYQPPKKRPPHDDGDLIKEPDQLGKPPAPTDPNRPNGR